MGTRKFVSQATIAAMRADLGDQPDHRVLDVTHTIPSDHPDLLVQLVTAFVDGLAA